MLAPRHEEHQQGVLYMMDWPDPAVSVLQDAVTCLKRRLQMDHPQKQYLAIILTSKVHQHSSSSSSLSRCYRKCNSNSRESASTP